MSALSQLYSRPYQHKRAASDVPPLHPEILASASLAPVKSSAQNSNAPTPVVANSIPQKNPGDDKNAKLAKLSKFISASLLKSCIDHD